MPKLYQNPSAESKRLPPRQQQRQEPRRQPAGYQVEPRRTNPQRSEELTHEGEHEEDERDGGHTAESRPTIIPRLTFLRQSHNYHTHAHPPRMSAAREVGGIRSRSGRRPTRQDDPCLSKRELETLRQGLHDSGYGPRHRCSPVAPPPQPVHRHALTWQPALIRALIRTGDLRSAAQSSRASYATVRSAATRQPVFRQQINAALSAWAARQLDRTARLGGRWHISRRTAQALMRHFSHSAVAEGA